MTMNERKQALMFRNIYACVCMCVFVCLGIEASVFMHTKKRVHLLESPVR